MAIGDDMKNLERIAAWIFGLVFLALAGGVAIETISRKVLNKSLQGIDELGGYALAVGASLAFAVALTSRAHIRIDVVHDRLPKPLRVALNLLATPLLAACALAVMWMAWLALADTIQFNATAQTPWATPLKFPQGLWVAALGLFALVALIECVRMGSLALRGRFDEIDRRYGPRGTKDELDEELADLKARGVAPVELKAGGVRS
jgi:TRAP-type C4-dicarboxylate transport system permease small subunit